MTEDLGNLRRKDLFWLSITMVSWPCTVVGAGWHSEVEEQAELLSSWGGDGT